MTSTPDAPQSPDIEAAARRLQEAAESGVPCGPVRDLIGADDVAAAYAVQSVIIGDRVAAGAKVVGRKIGLTSPAVQEWLGVDTPDFGVLLDDMEIGEDVGRSFGILCMKDDVFSKRRHAVVKVRIRWCCWILSDQFRARPCMLRSSSIKRYRVYCMA